MASLTFDEQPFLPFMDYPTPSGAAVDERELSAALAHYADNGPWFSEPFTYYAYDDGSDASHTFPPELAYPYPSPGLQCGSGHAITIAENNEEHLFATVDINDYFNHYQS